ncbi:MAG: hypothetical protein CML66_17615 [Rhodobacteraceae bacterium]|nr:hypothetical protein [Paracoccaceae bacterium]QEW21797.1 hypothetical protein LA6_004009 [Marinibacterium anthonyi]
MNRKIVKLCKDEGGAVTVDWVVLCAAVVALCGAAFYSIQEASGGVGTGVGTHLTDIVVE